MTTFKSFLAEEYNNWVRYNANSLAADFEEYKKKEKSKWQDRAEIIGSRFPIFSDLEQFEDALKTAKIVNIDNLGNVHNMSHNKSIASIEQMVSSYVHPRDVKRIEDGINNNVKLPLPIIIQGSKGLWILAGNTRQSVTRVLGHTPKALLINVENKNE